MACRTGRSLFFAAERPKDGEKQCACNGEDPKVEVKQHFAVRKVRLSGFGPEEIAGPEFCPFQQKIHHVVERLADLFRCPSGLFRHIERFDVGVVKRPAEDGCRDRSADGEQREQES